MFGLKVPVKKELRTPGFDGVQAIFRNSGLRESSPWSTKVNERGQIFYLEIEENIHDVSQDSISHLEKDCFCTCSDCATDDTGYSTDSDQISTKKEEENTFHSQSPISIKSDFVDCSKQINDLFNSAACDYKTIEECVDDLFRSNSGRIELDVTDDINLIHNDISRIFRTKLNQDCFNGLKRDVAEVSCDKSGERFSNSNKFRTQSSASIELEDRTKCKCDKRKERDTAEMEDERTFVMKLKSLRNKGEGWSAVEMCEKILGVIPGYFHSNGFGSSRRGKRKDQRVRVRGLVPIGVAARQANVRVGDWLKSINDQDVTWENLSSVLQVLLYQKQAKITVLHAKKQSENGSTILMKKVQLVPDHLVQLITSSNDDSFEVNGMVEDAQDPFYGVLYLSLEGLKSEDLKGKEDIVYQFPTKDNKITEIRGLFMTLVNIMDDVSDSSVQCSSVIYDDTQVQVAYYREGSSVFLIAAPENRIDTFALSSLVKDIVRLFLVMYGSVHNAFNQSTNHKQLHSLFTIIYQCHTSQLHDNRLSRLKKVNEVSQSVQCLPLPCEIKSEVGRTLEDFEAADFGDMSDSFYGCRRSYSILGSCIFFKDQLMCSHLPKEDLMDICLYLKYHFLFDLSVNQSLGQLVIWREIFPTRQCHDVPEEQSFGYSEPLSARWFWLVVGYKHMMLCALLEAGGCTLLKTGRSTPDPFLIDQAKVVLMHLDNLGITSHCENSRAASGFVSQVCPDDVCHASSRLDVLKKSFKKAPVKEYSSHLEGGSDSVVLPRRILHSRKDSLGSEGSTESGGSDSVFKISRKGRLFPDPSVSVHDIIDHRPEVFPVSFHRKLTVGTENCLFHFLYFDHLEGVVISTNQKLENSSHLARDIYQNFHHCCCQMKKSFDNARSKRVLIKEDKVGRYGIDDTFLMVREEAVLFTCTVSSTDKNSQTSLSYWVVGRCLSRSMKKEVFLCFHESAPQTVIELAYKLALGFNPS
ncbi:hypothetical protein CHS0354_012670 [Potamilus streckersoni]|uniref:Protein inturned n=1 Tax=Potamilus streckersoni TaxID=2493646 RepID=A0AAE0SXQ8_9BIVA|nr:hypothetical protein CHS0354_012670 [Potamilus streckersoni]